MGPEQVGYPDLLRDSDVWLEDLAWLVKYVCVDITESCSAAGTWGATGLGSLNEALDQAVAEVIACNTSSA